RAIEPRLRQSRWNFSRLSDSGTTTSCQATGLFVQRTEATVAVPEKSDETAISLANLPASARERRLVLVVAVLLFTAFPALPPFAKTPLPEFNAFVPSIAAAIFINDLIASVLLYSQYSIAPSRSFLVLAGGYLFMALIVIPHALTFPGAFTPTGLIGASWQSAM